MKLSCKEISFVVSESLDRDLLLRERLSVKIHLMMCKACQQMAMQMKLLRAVSRHSRTVEGDDTCPGQEETLSTEARARILKQLAKK